jgi:transcriptional regulator with XRE-family HTH domain
MGCMAHKLLMLAYMEAASIHAGRNFMQNNIAVIRKKKGLSLTDLARFAGTTKAQIQKLERGDRRLSLEWMERLASALQVKISDLLPPEAVSCQHGTEERAILELVLQLPVEERVTLVRMAAELLNTLRRLEADHTRAPKRLILENEAKTPPSGNRQRA